MCARNNDLPALARRVGRVSGDGLPVRHAVIRVVEDEDYGKGMVHPVVDVGLIRPERDVSVAAP
jgi:hypothetical protein